MRERIDKGAMNPRAKRIIRRIVSAAAVLAVIGLLWPSNPIIPVQGWKKMFYLDPDQRLR